MTDSGLRFIALFNGPVEIGLRALVLLTEAFPDAYSLQRLVVLDYLVVHSDDLPGGPPGLHPKTPHRSGELFVRRNSLQEGIRLYQSRGLIEEHYQESGVFYSATDHAGTFLDALRTDYLSDLRERAMWLTDSYGSLTDDAFAELIASHVDEWGAEFTTESVLWQVELP